ncbi:MAG: SPOR domain-containing protein [Qingshengfaniella sp.]
MIRIFDKAVLGALLAWAGSVGAAGPVLADPAEMPPPDFAGAQYVDSAGCLFTRADLGGRILWAGVAGPGGAPLCGQVPTEIPGRFSGALPAIPPNRSGTPPAFPGPGRYIQIGAFVQPAKADDTARQLLDEGLGLFRQDLRHRGGTMRVLFAGPLAAGPELAAVLRQIRGLGFADAFVWTVD